MKKYFYADYFTVPQDYKANMTREAINKTPETWLDFYPHTKYVEFLNTLLQVINGESKSLWLTGNYGTGKSNAALVTQKLFMDDEARVRKWFDDNKDKIHDSVALLKNLLVRRNDGTLIIYDYNASGVGPNEDFLVRLERGIVDLLNEKKMKVPAKANIDEIIQRLRREDKHFFATRDSLQGELAYLTADIDTIEKLVSKLEKAQKGTDTPSDLLGDVQKVLHKDNIYLDISVSTFRKWIREILSVNKIKCIVYIFDEFSEFIDSNKESLKTFEDVTENPSINRFYLVPVTHLSINAYWGERSENAGKANERFYFRNLQMPNETAFILAAHAMKPNQDQTIAKKWESDKNTLWEAVRGIVEVHFKPEDVSKQAFRNILPIHPMAAFLLKFLSEAASNQRSIFEYLKGSANGREFQDFIRIGGPDVASKQFLTVDYLWKYFIEREDLGLNKEIVAVRYEFERIKAREFQNKDDDDEDVRVLKTVLLFCLLVRLNPEGHERLKPTVQNIELAFQGDGAIVGVNGILKSLADKHCFSIVNGNIDLFTTSVGGAELQAKIIEYENKFHDLLSSKTEDMLTKNHPIVKTTLSSFSAGRFDVRISDVGHTNLTNFTSATRDKYSNGQFKDSGTVCLWFVVAKNKDDQLQIPEKIKGILTQLHDYRIIMFAFPNLTFCDTNQELWNDYVTQYAQYMLENDQVAKEQRKKAYERLENEWFDKIKKQETQIKVYQAMKDKVAINDMSWNTFTKYVEDYVRKTLPCCLDSLTPQITAFGATGLKSWAIAGIQFEAASGQYKQLVNNFKGQGISVDDDWFVKNPKHPLAQIRTFFDKKILSTVEKGASLSIRNAYIELQRAPFGMKYNVLSAFSLGFALRYILEKGYQWDNLQTTRTLDTDSLAEIIESAIKDVEKDINKGEKLICRLSKQELAFIEKAPKMLGIAGDIDEQRVEDVLLKIQTHIENISGHVPLWVLQYFIRDVAEPSADDIIDVLNNICLAGSISSKSDKIDDRTNAIKSVGTFILENKNLIKTVASYIKPDNFQTAFQMYIDKNANKLVSLSKSVGDISHDYCRSILEKVAETAGLLWKESDISAEIDETIMEYEILKLLKPIAGLTGFVPYKNAIDILKKAVTVGNKLPKTIITASEPSMSILLSAIAGNGMTSDIRTGLEQNINLVKALFFDISKARTLDILSQHLGRIEISKTDLAKIYSGLQNAFYNDESVFISDVRANIDNYIKDSVVQNIKNEWKRLSGADSPSAWAVSNNLPALFALSNITEADDIIKVIEKPEDFSSEKLSAIYNSLCGLTPFNIKKCQERFFDEILPVKYARFKINLSSLVGFLKSKYGKQPNNWPNKPDISEFIIEQYKETIAPQVIGKVKKIPADDLKKSIMKLIQDDPELGLLLWELK